jgi:hypothetical protein
MLQFLKLFQFVRNITCFLYTGLLTLVMNWQDMYEVSLDRIRQLNKEVAILEAILRSYLPILTKENNEKR